MINALEIEQVNQFLTPWYCQPDLLKWGKATEKALHLSINFQVMRDMWQACMPTGVQLLERCLFFKLNQIYRLSSLDKVLYWFKRIFAIVQVVNVIKLMEKNPRYQTGFKYWVILSCLRQQLSSDRLCLKAASVQLHHPPGLHLVYPTWQIYKIFESSLVCGNSRWCYGFLVLNSSHMVKPTDAFEKSNQPDVCVFSILSSA